MVPQLPPRPGGTGVALVRAGPRRNPPAVTAPGPPHEAAAEADARRDRVPLALRRAGAVATPPRPSLRVRDDRSEVYREVPARRVRLRRLRRQLQLARAGVDAHELPARRVAPPISQLLRRRLQGRVPHRLGHLPYHRPSGRRAVPPPHATVPEGFRVRAATGAGLPPQAPGRPALPRPRPVPRILR